MKFDLAINAMVLGLSKSAQIPAMKDGKQWRPFIYVNDTALAHAFIMNNPEDKPNGEIFNIGS